MGVDAGMKILGLVLGVGELFFNVDNALRDVVGC